VGRYGYPIVDTVPFRDADFTTILGAELHSGATQNGELWHILAVGLPAAFAPSNSPSFVPVAGQETGPQIAARAVAAGAFVAVAHPQWSGLTVEDARSITAAHAVEIYNHGCAMGCDRPDGFAIADQLLTEGRNLTLIATDDAHFSEPDHFGGWTMVKAETNTPEALLAALKAGAFYSTQGPELRDVRVEDGQTLLIPDFAGNLHFNTVGNLLLNPRAGLLFIDFEQGDLRYLTGQIEVIWEGAELRAFTGAERLLRFQLTAGRRVEGSLPLRWSAPDFSPFLERTGAWGSLTPSV
jgi:hypothetical protein